MGNSWFRFLMSRAGYFLSTIFLHSWSFYLSDYSKRIWRGKFEQYWTNSLHWSPTKAYQAKLSLPTYSNLLNWAKLQIWWGKFELFGALPNHIGQKWLMSLFRYDLLNWIRFDEENWTKLKLIYSDLLNRTKLPI